jgi:hypothetical protein
MEKHKRVTKIFEKYGKSKRPHKNSLQNLSLLSLGREGKSKPPPQG